MHLARVTCLEDQIDLRAREFSDQIMVHCADGQQRRDVAVLIVHTSVRENDQRLAGFYCLVRLASDAIERNAQTVDTLRDREQSRDRAAVKAIAIERPEFCEIRVRHDRVIDAQHASVQRGLFEKILPRPGGHRKLCHQLLADRVERRV